MLKLKTDQMQGDNKQLGKQVLGLVGDTIMALVVGMLGVVALFGIVSSIWYIINEWL
jgi:hypothetical protein